MISAERRAIVIFTFVRSVGPREIMDTVMIHLLRGPIGIRDIKISWARRFCFDQCPEPDLS